MLGAKRGLSMSFSGLKTAVSAHLHQHGQPQRRAGAFGPLCVVSGRGDRAACRKTALALDLHKLPAVVLSGGVACNRALRASVAALCEKRGLSFSSRRPGCVATMPR